jgi:hypothetical protein
MRDSLERTDERFKPDELVTEKQRENCHRSRKKITKWRFGMKCQRCTRDEAAYRVYSDAIDMEVCFACAEEASRLGITVEVLHSGARRKRPRISCQKFE